MGIHPLFFALFSHFLCIFLVFSLYFLCFFLVFFLFFSCMVREQARRYNGR
nr:MAG TPA: chitin synthase regulator [Caudoviricetes sp.]DAL05634.1 MAG TPA: chitin synthase regulator [Caudoviricetes sp.]